ncbi:hypothetical protein M5E06_31635 [Azospirillum sp. A1-3]|nr:hypothetical protein [Azospirillum sp. A1-3]MCM8738663.1 hypothetical protein [Azospirillum sp. A1-3]
MQPAANLTQAQAIQADPGKHQAYPAGFVGNHLDTRHSTAFVFGDVAIAERGFAQGADLPGASGVPTAASATFQDLGALVLGDHPLDLEQEVVFGTGADGMVDEDDLGTGPAELLDEKDLIGVTTREPVRGMDVDLIDYAGRYGIA